MARKKATKKQSPKDDGCDAASGMATPTRPATSAAWARIAREYRELSALPKNPGSVVFMREAMPRLWLDATRLYFQNIEAGTRLSGGSSFPTDEEKAAHGRLSLRGEIKRTERVVGIREGDAIWLPLRNPAGNSDEPEITKAMEAFRNALNSWAKQQVGIRQPPEPVFNSGEKYHTGEWIVRCEHAIYLADALDQLADSESWAVSGEQPQTPSIPFDDFEDDDTSDAILLALIESNGVRISLEKLSKTIVTNRGKGFGSARHNKVTLKDRLQLMHQFDLVDWRTGSGPRLKEKGLKRFVSRHPEKCPQNAR